MESEGDYRKLKADTKIDMKSLRDLGLIQIEDDGKINWVDNKYPLRAYDKLKLEAKKGRLYLINDTNLIWVFPDQIFREGLFDEIYIMTHRFDCQLQACYFKFFGLPYRTCYLIEKSGRYEITENSSLYDETKWKQEIKKHIEIWDNKRMNKIGDDYKAKNGRTYNSALSKSWYAESRKRHKERIWTINRNLDNFFKNITKSRADERLWTCFKDDLNLLTSKNVSDDYWLALNARATNEWEKRKFLAYLVNRFLDPSYKIFFAKKTIEVDEDQFAVSECVQWIWRSAIRNNEDIKIYLPSSRMKRLLKDYLEIKDEEPLKEKSVFKSSQES